MKTLSTMFSAFLGLAFLAALGFDSYFAITCAVGLLAKLDVQLATPTAIASLVILLAAMIITGSIRQTSRQHKANALHCAGPYRGRVTAALFADTNKAGARAKAQPVMVGVAGVFSDSTLKVSRCARHDNAVQRHQSNLCHPERSEGSAVKLQRRCLATLDTTMRFIVLGTTTWFSVTKAISVTPSVARGLHCGISEGCHIMLDSIYGAFVLGR